MKELKKAFWWYVASIFIEAIFLGPVFAFLLNAGIIVLGILLYAF